MKVKASRKSHTLLSSETPDFVGTFRLIPSDSRLTVKKVKKVIVSEGHILPLTRSMPIRTSVKVSVEGNS